MEAFECSECGNEEGTDWMVDDEVTRRMTALKLGEVTTSDEMGKSKKREIVKG